MFCFRLQSMSTSILLLLHNTCRRLRKENFVNKRHWNRIGNIYLKRSCPFLSSSLVMSVSWTHVQHIRFPIPTVESNAKIVCLCRRWCLCLIVWSGANSMEAVECRLSNQSRSSGTACQSSFGYDVMNSRGSAGIATSRLLSLVGKLTKAPKSEPKRRQRLQSAIAYLDDMMVARAYYTDIKIVLQSFCIWSRYDDIL